ncbi:MAG: hypothetical protein J3Q66DRAFT_324315 [Benniella sp.]|nr:MAG: hypothetical protein J3Q66DRAFT_324315 [Benniella sp.]
MLSPLSSHTILIPITLTFISLCSVFPHLVFATNSACSVFVEGRGLYTFGGYVQFDMYPDQDVRQVFMLDLSVSWNTSNPVIKQLENGPKVKEGPCAATNDGENIFVLSSGQGHVYNVQSNSWTVLGDNNLASYRWRSAATDPETGIIYFPDTTNLTYSLDLRTNTVNTTGSVDIWFDATVIWSAYLKSMVIIDQDENPQVFTPSKVSESSTGWSILKTGAVPDFTNRPGGDWNCGVPAYGGSKLVFVDRYEKGDNEDAVFTLDVKKGTWTRGPPFPANDIRYYCAVIGDQLVLMGSENDVRIYNMKTGNLTSRYIAPPPRPTSTTARTTRISQLPQTPTQPIPIPYTTAASDHSNASSIDMKVVTIIIVVAGILLTALNVYLGISKRSKIDAQRTSIVDSSLNPRNTQDHTDTSDKKEQSIGSSRRRDPSESGNHSTGVSSNDSTQRKWFMAGQFGRLHQGIFGARELSEHPHAILEDPTSKRNAQEGAFGAQVLSEHPHAIVEDPTPRHVQEGASEVEIFSQHPHAMVGDEYMRKYGDKVMHQSIRYYGDKEELRDQ